MIEVLQRYTGQQVTVYIRGSGESGRDQVQGVLTECHESCICVLGKNGNHFLIAVDRIESVEATPPPGATGTHTLPRSA